MIQATRADSGLIGDSSIPPRVRYLNAYRRRHHEEEDRRAREESEKERQRQLERDAKKKEKTPWPSRASRFDDCPKIPNHHRILPYFSTEEGIIALESTIAQDQPRHPVCPNKKKQSSAGKELKSGVYIPSTSENHNRLPSPCLETKHEVKTVIESEADGVTGDFLSSKLIQETNHHESIPIGLTPSHLHFGTVEVGESMTATVILTNHSQKSLLFTLRMDADHISADCWRGPLPAGHSRRIEITFHAQEASNIIGELWIISQYQPMLLTYSVKAINSQ